MRLLNIVHNWFSLLVLLPIFYIPSLIHGMIFHWEATRDTFMLDGSDVFPWYEVLFGTNYEDQ